MLAWIADVIHEGLPSPDFKAWPTRFADAVVVGSEPIRAVERWYHWLTADFLPRQLPEESHACKDAILAIAALHRRRVEGDNPPATEWYAAGSAAESAAYREMADKLVESLAALPVSLDA